MNPTPTPNSPAPVDIARLRELLAKATQENWTANEIRSEMAYAMRKEDAELFAALRNDAPALLDEVERLREQVKCLVHNWQGQITRTNAERDKLREEVEKLKATNECAVKSAIEQAEQVIRLKEVRDSLRQQNEQLLKEIEELRARPTGLWKENY